MGAESVSAEVLGLSKMNFNNDALYGLLPITIKYAGILAEVVKRMPRLRHARTLSGCLYDCAADQVPETHPGRGPDWGRCASAARRSRRWG
jgi:hypothetical protein